MYEHRHQPMLTKAAFAQRFLGHASVAVAVIAGSMVVGTLGYRYIGNVEWIDAFHNAAMLLGGMGPVLERPLPVAGKIFSSLFALYSGLVFLIVAGVLFAPIVHRLLHHFHVELDDKDK